MNGPVRVTRPLLDVLEVFLQAFEESAQLHGWAISKATLRSGPTVYQIIDRLEDAGWVTGRWEEQQPDQNRPRRRLYQLTPTGAAQARELIASRRPEAASRLGAARPAPELGLSALRWARLAGGTR